MPTAIGQGTSAHHYFRRFSYCDSGMIPAAGVGGGISARGQSLSALVGERMRLFPASGEINRRLAGDAKSILARVRAHYEPLALAIDFTDGLSMEFEQWRFNLRGSNTEPLVRLNVESRGERAAHAREDRRGAEARRRRGQTQVTRRSRRRLSQASPCSSNYSS